MNMKEKTLIIFKPDSICRNLVSTIKILLLAHGFNIVDEKEIIVDAESIINHYSNNILQLGNEFKKNIEEYYVGQKVIVAILEGYNVLSEIRNLIGVFDPQVAEKGTIRGDFGEDSFALSQRENRICENLIHASSTYEDYEKERRIWFLE